jgi:mono/diheme cytochrome c family protein
MQAALAFLRSIACALLPILLSAAAGCGDGRNGIGDGGQRLFEDACGPCHDPSGGGRPGRGPSLRDSAYLASPPDVLIRIVLDGLQSEEAERSAQFALPMPSWRILADQDMAALVTFVQLSWGSNQGPVTAADVAAVRNATINRSRPWTPQELRGALRAGSGR